MGQKKFRLVSLTCIREDRLTFAVDELPKELKDVLKQTHELHIRWSSAEPYETVAPLLSRLPPGLHVFYTPLDAQAAESEDICNLLHTAFGKLDCITPRVSFTAIEQGRFSHSSAYQYYQQLENPAPLSTFSEYAKEKLCKVNDAACLDEMDDHLAAPAYIDISFDAISHALKVTAVSRYYEHDDRITRDMRVTSRPGHRTEVGILSEDKPPTLEPEEIGISGLLTVLEQDSKPSPVLFSFPSRHRHAEGEFTSKLLQPTGLHPTLQLSIASTKPPLEDAYCSPHAYYTLPRWIFPDRYQLSDDLFLASKNLTALRYVSQPVDLEAPEYAMKIWGSAMLLELSPPAIDGQPWTVEVPLHLRYLTPAEEGYQHKQIPYPAVFWACNAEEGTKFPVNPFDRVNLGYDGLFGPRTVFWHVDPKPETGGSLSNDITIPVLDTAKAGWVNAGTAAVVMLGFAWVLWKLFGVYTQVASSTTASTPVKGTEDKKTK